jgi:hypothetical protein
MVIAPDMPPLGTDPPEQSDEIVVLEPLKTQVAAKTLPVPPNKKRNNNDVMHFDVKCRVVVLV